MDPFETMREPRPPEDPAALALAALAWTLGEADRAARLLALTGLAPADLRERAEEPALLAAVLGFLAGHEPDLIACADALGRTPAALIRAKEELET